MTDERTKRMSDFLDIANQVAMSRDPGMAMKGRFGRDVWQPARNWILDERERAGQPINQERALQHAEILYVLASGLGALGGATINETFKPNAHAGAAEQLINVFIEACLHCLTVDGNAKALLMAKLARERGKP